ncbi:MAG: lipid-A-disaccharide synthase [Desulfopila sp.]
MQAATVMIVTGEASGDVHGANLVKAMRNQDPALGFVGMGGEEMAAAGVRLLYDAARISVVGVAEVVAHLGDILKAQRVLKQYLLDHRPQLLIIIDLPDFNLLLAKFAKKLGIRVFYYICPQVWAWRSGRVKTIRRRVDICGVILPFEEQFLRQRGVAATYVGHPLLDSVSVSCNRDEFRQLHGIEKNRRCIGLLPGSRKREVAMLLPVFLAAARQLQRRCPERLCFLLPQASTISDDDLKQAGLGCGSEQSELDIHTIKGDRYNLMAACDGAVAASGTVTLELAILAVPMVVTYRLAPLTYRLGRLLVDLDYFSLVNLIAGSEVVPELLQDQVTAEAIAGHLQNVLFNRQKRAAQLAGIARVRQQLGSGGASDRAARLAIRILQQERCHGR